MKFRMLFPAVLIDFLNSKVCLQGERSIKRDSNVKSSHLEFTRCFLGKWFFLCFVLMGRSYKNDEFNWLFLLRDFMRIMEV